MKIIAKIASVAAVLVLISCSSNKKEDKEKVEQINFINPAFKEFNIPFEEFSFDSQSGDTIFCKSGTILLFPPNSFVDNKGNLIKGKVNITYREFSNPIDFFVSGIPMNYDSANTKYFFESAGMCEIYASKESVPVFVNPKNKPEVNLVSNNKSENFNLYYLDTIQKKWINIINSTPADIVENSNARVKIIDVVIDSIFPPIKPLKSDGSKPVIEIDVAPGSVKELQAYNDLKFEIVDRLKTTITSDTAIEWEDIIVEKGSNPGTYKAIFKKGKNNTSYIVRPVFEGKSYDEAIKVFEVKQKEYQQIKATRLVNEKFENEMIAKENERIAKLNLLIEARNKIIDQKNREIISEQNKTYAAQQKRQIEIIEKKKQEEKKDFESGGIKMENQVIRTFYIAEFGTYNCDKPIPQFGNGNPILAKFIDKSGKDIQLNRIILVTKGLNSIQTFTTHNIKVNFLLENTIWSIVDNKFVYLSFDDFKKCGINSSTTQYTFPMKIYASKISSREDIRKIVGF